MKNNSKWRCLLYKNEKCGRSLFINIQYYISTTSSNKINKI